MHEVRFNKDGRMVNRKLLSKALKLKNQGLLVDFAWKKTILAEEVPLNELVIKECDNIEIPVSLQKIGNLKVISTKLSVPAFGKNDLPFDVSQKWELSGSKICSTTFEGFNLSSLAFRYLRLPTELTNVQAKLQKLILFGYGGFIQSNSDCMVDGKIGTVILQLPVEGGHLGGNLNVEYKGRTKIFENHPRSDKNFYLSAFYNCCEYFTKPVTQGYQLNLVFDLIWTNVKIGIPQELPVFLTSLKQVKEALKPWTQRMDFQEEKVGTDVICTKIKMEDKVHQHNPVGQVVSQPPDMNVSLEGPFSESLIIRESDCLSEKNLKENILFFILHEKYDVENFGFEFLRGKDRKMADLLQSCVFLDVHIAMASESPLKMKTEKSLDSRCFEPVANLTTEENNEGIEISNLIDSDNVTRNVRIELKWRNHLIEDIASDREKNYRDKIELAKKHLDNGVMVIWPKYQAAQIYCRYGLESLLSSMEKSVSLPKWQEDARQSATTHLRQLISFCYAEPQRAWTKSGLGKGELTLRVLRLCIAMSAHEEGLDLLKLLGSNFESRGKFDAENFEGIQNEEVAQAISDFVNEVTGRMGIAELIEPLLSRDRISKQLLPILKLAKCFLRSSCKEGATMVGNCVSSFFAELDQTCASRSKEFDVEAYLDTIVDLELNPETSSRKRTASFILFFAKVRSSLQCRLLLYFEAQFRSPLKNNQSCQDLFNALCLKILSADCNIYAPPVKTIIVDLVSCFIRLGNTEFLQSLILKMCQVPDKVPEGIHVRNQNLVEKIVSSPAIWELATSSEEGRSTMASLVDHHLTLLTHQLSAFEDDGNAVQITPPDKIKNVAADQEAVFRNNWPWPCGLSPCIWYLMEIQEHYDDEDSHCLPIRVRVEWKTSLILAKLCAQQLMQLLIDVLKEHSGYLNKHLLSFGTLRTCRLFFSRMKDNVTVMPRRETVLELVNWFILAGDDTLVRFILEQVCSLEKLGTWSYQQKYELFEMLVSSPEVWIKFDSGSKLLVLKSCVDVVIMCNDFSQNSSILHDCVRLLFLVEKNQPPDGPSIATHVFTQFLTKITTPQLMELLLDFQLFEKKDPNITNFPACTEWYFIAYRIFFKQDFVSFVKSTEENAKKILKCLFWLNDFACWECFELQLCQSFPSEEGNLFLKAVVNNEDLREVCLNAPFALNAFRRILNHWIQYSNPQKELPFTWRQPHAVLSDHPRVEMFLRSSQECMTYANFHDFSEARLFGEGLERSGPEHGFSVRAFPGGKGKYSYCEIVKNLVHPSFFTKIIEARKSELEKLVQLRQDLHHGLYNSSQEAVQDAIAYFQGYSELSTTTGNWSSTFNASQTAYTAPTPVNSQTDDWNAASHACASVISTTSTVPMSTTSSKTSNDDDWSERIDNLAADFRKAGEQLPIAPPAIPPPDDLVAFVDDCLSSEKNATTKRRAIRLGCQSSSDGSSQVTTASMSITPPASWCSWKIPKTKESRGNEDLAPEADAGRVKGRTNVDGKKSGRRACSSSKRNPPVSGANALPVCDRKKKTVNADPRICRKSIQRGHTFLKCPNDPIDERNVEKNPISLSSAASVCINLVTNEDWSVENARPYKETSRDDVSSRRKVAGNVYSWKRGQKTRRSIEPKPSDNWGASGDAWAPFPTLPDLPSTSGTSGITRAGLDKCDLHSNGNENVPAPKHVIDVEKRWNLKEIESSRKHDSLQAMGQFCETDLNKSDGQVPGIRKVVLNVRENSIHCPANSVLPDMRKKSNDVQLAAASICFPKLSRTLNPLPSTVEVCPVAWKGSIDGGEMGQVNVQALNIRNSTDLVDVSMPPSLFVVGRIRPERVWDYINQIRWAATHDVVILKFIPACDSDQKNYASFLSQLQQRDRFAVVGRGSKHIRDFYLISLPEGSALPSALASLTSATKLLDKNRKSSLLVGIVVRSRMNGKTGVDGAVVPTETTDASIEIVAAEPPSSSVRNSTAIRESNPPSLINIPTSKFFSALDVDMRITPPHAVMADVLKNLDIGDLQKILKTVQTKEENTCLRKRKFGDVDTDAEIIPTKLVKVAIDSSAETVPCKVTALPVKSLPPTSVSSSSVNPIYICTSWPSSSTSDRIAKTIQTGPQSADLALYSPGLPMEPVIHIPAIDEDVLKRQNELMEELNSALPAWLAVDKKKTVMSENIQGPQQ